MYFTALLFWGEAYIDVIGLCGFRNHEQRCPPEILIQLQIHADTKQEHSLFD